MSQTEVVTTTKRTTTRGNKFIVNRAQTKTAPAQMFSQASFTKPSRSEHPYLTQTVLGTHCLRKAAGEDINRQKPMTFHYTGHSQ